MAEKVKAKKAKAPAKKASPATKARKSEVIAKQEEEASPVIKRNKSGKILSKAAAQEAAPETIEADEAEDAADELPPLEQKFTAAETISAKPAAPAQNENSEQLRLKLSKSLIRKLREQAADEGIGLDEFVTELLSESVVLRAWEIVERKNQMKGGSAPGGNHNRAGNNIQHNNNNQQNRNGQGHRGNKGHRGMNHSRYQTIMEDKGAFMEYVRGQERNRR